MTQREFDIVVCQHALVTSNSRMRGYKWWRGYAAIWLTILVVASFLGGAFSPTVDIICMSITAVSTFANHWLIQREHKIATVLYARRAALGELKIEEARGDQAEVAESQPG